MSLSFDIAGSQINGDRDYQEDAFLITHLAQHGAPDGGALVIVADGMGGHAAGNVASNLAVQTFNKYVTTGFPTDNTAALLRDSVKAANSSIRETVRETPALRGMGCTFVGALVTDRYLRWVSVGDSHLYLLRGTDLKKRNADHSYGGFLDRMAAAGKQVEPESGFSRNMLMSALTGEDIADIDCPDAPFELHDGDRIIVASDGLDAISQGKVLQFCTSTRTARECVDALLKAVVDAAIPRQDNTTVVVIDVHGKAPPPKPAPRQAGPTIEPMAPPPRPAAAVPRPSLATAPRSGASARARSRKSGQQWLPAALVGVLLVGGGAGYLWYSGQIPELMLPKPKIVESETAAIEPPPPAPSEPSVATSSATSDTAPATAPIAVEEFRDGLKGGGQGPAMVWVPAGRFVMGTSLMSPDVLDEKPEHEVAVGRYAIGRYEVTIAEYERFAQATGRRAPSVGSLDKSVYPVAYVSWNDAVAYTAWLSKQTGARYRLPTEAEWEYAARAGTVTAYWWGSSVAPGMAHCFGCKADAEPRQPTRIGSFAANPWGLFDVAGNVAEWVQDCYAENYDQAPADGTALEIKECKARVARGGSFMSVPKSIRTSKREQYDPARNYDNVGLRVVRDP